MNARLIAYAFLSGVLLLVGWQWHDRGQRIEGLIESKAALSAKLSEQRDQCIAEQKATDEALATIRAAGEDDRKAREAAERRAAQASRDAERRVRAALTADVPESCAEAVEWLGDYGRELAQGWMIE